MHAREFIRWLKKQGVQAVPQRGKGGHVLVKKGDKTSVVPVHGKNKELGPRLVNKIKRDLGLK